MSAWMGLTILLACGGCVDMDKHRWQERVILLFADDPANEDYRAMRNELDAERQGVEERDLVIYEFFFDDADADEAEESAAAANAEAWEVEPEGFTYLLIGKDGEVKARSREAVAVEAIFRQIDSMPMRQREMRQRND